MLYLSITDDVSPTTKGGSRSQLPTPGTKSSSRSSGGGAESLASPSTTNEPRAASPFGPSLAAILKSPTKMFFFQKSGR